MWCLQIRRRCCAGEYFTTVVDFSTIGMDATLQFAGSLANASGDIWIDAPVSGGVAGATSGTLAIFVGSNGPSIERVLRRFALWRDASRIWPPWVAESHIAARRADWRVLGLDPQKQTGRFPDGSLPKMETAKWI